ncbi:hypothetical protein NL676_004278 [Syzygium grande]|nr:hypothetical protein NL676_004278 [Syzygium grande]
MAPGRARPAKLPRPDLSVARRRRSSDRSAANRRCSHAGNRRRTNSRRGSQLGSSPGRLQPGRCREMGAPSAAVAREKRP